MLLDFLARIMYVSVLHRSTFNNVNIHSDLFTLIVPKTLFSHEELLVGGVAQTAITFKHSCFLWQRYRLLL